MMEIKASDNSHLNSHAIKKAEDIINKLEASLFRAIITAKTGQQTFTLQTAVGKLPIATDLPVQLGDELVLNVKKQSQGQLPELVVAKIARQAPLVSNTPSLSATANTNKTFTIKVDQLIQNFPSNKPHFVAQITDISPLKIQLTSIDKTQFNIKPEAFRGTAIQLKEADFLIFNKKTSTSIDITPINKQALLHEVQKQILPKQAAEATPYKTLTRLANKLMATIQGNQTNAQSEQTVLASNASAAPKSSIQTVKLTPTNLSVLSQLNSPQIQPLLTQLKQLINAITLQAHSITPSVIKNVLSQLIFFNSENPKINPHTNHIQQFSSISESLNAVIKELTAHGKHSQQDTDVISSDLLKTLIQETKQSVDQLVHKMLFQSASNKLSHENQQTVVINTQIPIAIDKQIKDVSITIKQDKQSQQENNDDVWEIQLAFEFGLLGLISTKIFVKNNFNVIVNFWTETAETQQLLSQKQHLFNQQMINAGLELEGFNCYLGAPPFDNSISIASQQKSFIDIKV